MNSKIIVDLILSFNKGLGLQHINLGVQKIPVITEMLNHQHYCFSKAMPAGLKGKVSYSLDPVNYTIH